MTYTVTHPPLSKCAPPALRPTENDYSFFCALGPGDPGQAKGRRSDMWVGLGFPEKFL